MVSNQYSSQYKQNQYFIYDQSEKDLIYFTESSLLFLPFSNYRLNNLILYPSNQIIASIENIRLLNNNYQTYMNIFDDKYNKWINGQIFRMNSYQSFKFRLKYNNKFYTMENKYSSSITEIRDENNKNYILSCFYQKQIYENSLSSKYKIEIYKNDLPDSFHVVALNILDSIKMKTMFNEIF